MTRAVMFGNAHKCVALAYLLLELDDAGATNTDLVHNEHWAAMVIKLERLFSQDELIEAELQGESLRTTSSLPASDGFAELFEPGVLTDVFEAFCIGDLAQSDAVRAKYPKFTHVVDVMYDQLQTGNAER